MPTARTGRRNWIAPAIIIVIAAVMIAVVLFSKSGPGSGAAPPESEEPTASNGVVSDVVEPTPASRVDVERHDPEDPLAIGEVDAPVTIVMYSDFQCGFCALWTAQTLPEILPYVDNDQVRIEWRDLALFGEASHRAALAGYAAGMQGKYAEFNRALFGTGETPSAEALSDDGLVALAENLGLDVEQFEDDRTSDTVAQEVQANITEAEDLGAFSTPAFLINGLPVVGAQPADVFLDTIDSELNGSS